MAPVMDQSPRAPALPWPTRAWRQILRLWVRKMTVTTVAMAVFFVAYFQVMRHSPFAATVMPLTAVDRAIPFQPSALFLYATLWLYVSLAPALMADGRRLLLYLGAAVVLSGAGLMVFFFAPTVVPKPDIDWAAYPSFGFLKGLDAAGNACPSLHVAFAVFSAAWFERLLRELRAGALARVAAWLWCGGIVYSTIAVRQHVAWDVVAGAGLGAVVVAVHLALDRRLTPPGGWIQATSWPGAGTTQR